MVRNIIKLSVLSLAALGVGFAGQVQLGGANGLTSAYIASGCSGAGPCVAGSTGGAWTETSDKLGLFNNVNTAAVPTSPMTDSTNGVTFNMINDGANKNVWVALNTTAPTLTIPVGIFGVQSVWTMLNADLALITPGRDVTVFFDFGSTSNATSGLTTVTVKLTNSGTNGSGPTGQIQDSVICTNLNVALCPTTWQGAQGPTLTTTVADGTLIPNGVTVKTNQLYSASYTNGDGSGNVVLDDQGFIFSGGVATTALNSYLVDVRIREVGALTGTSAMGVSAVTVFSAPTPEPSTIFMALGGLGLVGLGSLRRRIRGTR